MLVLAIASLLVQSAMVLSTAVFKLSLYVLVAASAMTGITGNYVVSKQPLLWHGQAMQLRCTACCEAARCTTHGQRVHKRSSLSARKRTQLRSCARVLRPAVPSQRRLVCVGAAV